MPTDTQILSTLIKRMKNQKHDPLRPLIDAYWLERRKSPHVLQEYRVPMLERPRPGGRLSPSSMGGCEREAAFKFLGVEGQRRIDPDLEEIFDDGNWRHHKWQARFYDMERVLGSKKFKVYGVELEATIPELYTAGSLDAKVRMDKRKWIIDFKGINDYGFKHVKQQDRPEDKHVFQLLTYMKGARIPRGILLYENKNNNQTLSFVIDFDQDEWDYVARWANRVIKQMERQELPERHTECMRGNFLWEKCPFADQCYGSKTPEQLRRHTYKHFEGVEEMWKRGLEITRNHSES